MLDNTVVISLIAAALFGAGLLCGRLTTRRVENVWSIGNLPHGRYSVDSQGIRIEYQDTLTVEVPHDKF